MAADIWNGGIGGWSVAANWSAGVPTSTSAVSVFSGEADAASPIGIASLVNSATVALNAAGASTISGAVNNSGFFLLDATSASGGSSLAAGALRNSGVLQLGADDNSLSSSDTVKFALINNYAGEIDVDGGATSAAKMTLNITVGAAGLGVAGQVLGDVSVSGDAVIEFKSGQINTIDSGATLTLVGPSAFLADAFSLNANSALAGLALNAGVFSLLSGAAVTTGALDNINEIFLGSAVGEAASQLSVGGDFTNNGVTGVGSQVSGGAIMTVTGAFDNEDELDIGESKSRRSSTVSVKTLVNHGTISLFNMTPTAALSLLKVGAVAGFGQLGHLSGSVSLSGDSEVQFASGSVTQIDAGADLTLAGANARIADAAAPSVNSALSGLSAIYGAFNIISGAKVTVSAGLTVEASGSLTVDNSYALNGEGGSTVSIGGALVNQGSVQIGANRLTTAANVTVGALNGYGSLSVIGDFFAPEKATLAVKSVAGFNAAGVLIGTVTVKGDAAITFASGQISTIGDDGILQLWGHQATISDTASPTTNSALQGLTLISYNGGELDLEDGSQVSLTGTLTNDDQLRIDTQKTSGSSLNVAGGLVNNGYIEVGAGSLKVGGLLTNNNEIDVGDDSLAANAMISAVQVLAGNNIFLSGSNGFNAELAVSGAFTNNSTVFLDTDTETIAGAVSGSGGGDFDLDNSTLVFGSSVDANQTITFNPFVSSASNLTLDRADLFTGDIASFHADDSVLAANFGTGTTWSFSGDVLSLKNGATTANLNFGAGYVSADFSVNVGSAGTTVSFV